MDRSTVDFRRISREVYQFGVRMKLGMVLLTLFAIAAVITPFESSARGGRRGPYYQPADGPTHEPLMNYDYECIGRDGAVIVRISTSQDGLSTLEYPRSKIKKTLSSSMVRVQDRDRYTDREGVGLSFKTKGNDFDAHYSGAYRLSYVYLPGADKFSCASVRKDRYADPDQVSELKDTTPTVAF